MGYTEVSPVPLSRGDRSPLLQREMPGLDAARGLAVLAVVLSHAVHPAVGKFSPHPATTDKLVALLAAGGWAGVELFFVLSGFLITGILLDTRTQKIYWRGFYTRRALRILPLYLTILLIVHFAFHLSWLYFFLCLGFLANLANRFMPSYGPTWSLAVEEQFYLVWPALVRRLRPRTLAVLCLVSITLSPALRILSTHLPFGAPYDLTCFITDYLCFGALLAIFLRSRHATARNVTRVIIALALASVLSFAVCSRLRLFDRAGALGGAEPILFFSGFLVLIALRYGSMDWVKHLTAPLRFYGYISYGLYLLNFGFLRFYFGRLDRGLSPYRVITPLRMATRFLPALLIMTLLCFISRRYFEEYFLRLKHRLVPYRTTQRERSRPAPNGYSRR
jgi:peptidoglycan/LPS O-acetylase OafA/YrhL